MKIENNDRIALKESDIKHVYGETIFYRGQDYFDDDRVTSVIKFKDKLTGEVEGSTTYKTDVDLNDLQSECSCPYGINCKHGVAVLLQYMEGEYSDADKVTKSLDRMSREELRGVIDSLISANPTNLMYLGIQAEVVKKPDGNLLEALDKQIESRLQRIMKSNGDDGSADELAGFIKINESVLSKEQVFHIIEFLVDNCEDFGCFYDDYSDSNYGEEIFENLCDAFVKKQMEEKDFVRLKDISERDNYDMLAAFINRLPEIENLENLRDFEESMRNLLDESSYVDFLINCGLTEKARTLIESSESLGEESRFRPYLRIDERSALEFAYRNGAFSSLLKYYHETGAHDEVVRLLSEVVKDASKNFRLKEDPIQYWNILSSIDKSEKRTYHEEVLRALFEKCKSFQYFGLCANIGLRLDDKELLRKLLDKESSYYFNVDEKIKVLEYLKEDYGEEVLREFKKLVSSLINEMGARQYKKAAECVFLLRDRMDEEVWEEYVKGLYLGHTGKRNLWNEFEERGISLRMKKGEVFLDDKSNYAARKR
ncbi:MAG: SWIM zinc finger family protein [Euryarchaeota archaeon]|nr:SWIM zinc finger family protein [Euryarchaeota archaeon]